MHDVTRLLRRNFDSRVQALGLTQTQWRALANLSRCEGINQAALADILEVQPISLARLIDRMEAAGWVERRPDPRDRRALTLWVTEKAQPILSELWDRAAETREQALAGLSRDDRNRLMEALNRMKSNLAAAEPDSDRGSASAPGKGTGIR